MSQVKTNSHAIQLLGNVSGTGGLSGSPVMVQGKIIGVFKGSLKNLFFATKSDTLLSLLKRPFINKDFNDLKFEITESQKMLSSFVRKS